MRSRRARAGLLLLVLALPIPATLAFERAASSDAVATVRGASSSSSTVEPPGASAGHPRRPDIRR